MYVSDIRKITIWQAVMSVMISGKNPQCLVKLVGKLCWKIEYCIGSKCLSGDQYESCTSSWSSPRRAPPGRDG